MVNKASRAITLPQHAASSRDGATKDSLFCEGAKTMEVQAAMWR